MTVICRPVVAILATGDELVNIGQPLPVGKIYNSNTYSVAALILRYGGIPKILGIALDSEDSLVTRLRQGSNANMLITTGGVSTGNYDVAKDVLTEEGEIAFWTVQMKPGKPLAFGTIREINKSSIARNIPRLCLPVNPVSSMVTFELFARPACQKAPNTTIVVRKALLTAFLEFFHLINPLITSSIKDLERDITYLLPGKNY